MLTCHLQLKLKDKKKSLMYRLFVKMKHFSGVFTHFDSFLPSTYKFGTAYILAYRCLRICSSWTKLYRIILFKTNFLKNGYPENFINKCFKRLTDNIHVVKKTTLTAEKKPLVLVIPWFNPYIGSISLQTWAITRAKLQNKCLNVRERVEVVEWNRTWSPPFPCCPVSRQCPWKKILIEKKTWAKLKKSLKNTLNCCKVQIVFKDTHREKAPSNKA